MFRSYSRTTLGIVLHVPADKLDTAALDLSFVVLLVQDVSFTAEEKARTRRGLVITSYRGGNQA